MGSRALLVRASILLFVLWGTPSVAADPENVIGPPLSCEPIVVTFTWDWFTTPPTVVPDVWIREDCLWG